MVSTRLSFLRIQNVLSKRKIVTPENRPVKKMNSLLRGGRTAIGVKDVAEAAESDAIVASEHLPELIRIRIFTLFKFIFKEMITKFD